MTQLSFYIRQLMNRMWFLPAVFSLIAVVTVATAFFVAGWAPEELPFTISQSSVQSVLEVMASSLLTVAVFALSTLVAALSSASSTTTPRAVPLIIGDRAAQTSISVFIGAFLFSILAILGLSAGVYSSAGRMVLFSVTLAVVAAVVIALIRWIAQISDIGRVSHTVDRVEQATRAALDTLKEHSLFDCRELRDTATGTKLYASRLGYVQHIDANRLQNIAEENDLQIAVLARPGAYATAIRPLMAVEGQLDERARARLVEAFVIGDQRTFSHDPRFGLIALTEIADRALSPGINDPGTAIDVIGTLTRLLTDWAPGGEKDEVRNDRVAVLPLDANDVIEDAFRPIARDGAGIVEVVLRLLEGLETVAATNQYLRQAAIDAGKDALLRAEAALSAPADIAAVRKSIFWDDRSDGGRELA